MLTRLKVTGFKNLVDVDIRFGPFTCIAGVNGVGKSNLFDAIRFLSALADQPLIEAAKSVAEGRTADVHNLFHRVGDRYDDRMSFEAEMIVPAEGEDDLGQTAEAGITFLRYTLELVRRQEDSRLSLGGLEIEKEELVHINLSDATKHLLFTHKPIWRRSVVKGRRIAPFISTDPEGGTEDKTERVIRMHQDGGGGNPASRRAANLPRTVLSAANAAENPTALLRDVRCNLGDCFSSSPPHCASPMNSRHLLVWAPMVPTLQQPFIIWRERAKGQDRTRRGSMLKSRAGYPS